MGRTDDLQVDEQALQVLEVQEVHQLYVVLEVVGPREAAHKVAVW